MLHHAPGVYGDYCRDYLAFAPELIGVVNYLLTTLKITSSNIEWLCINANRASCRDIHQYLGRLSLLHGQPARRFLWCPQDQARYPSHALMRFKNSGISRSHNFYRSSSASPCSILSDHGGILSSDDYRQALSGQLMLSTFTYKLAFSTYKFSLASASAVIILLLSMSVALFYVRHQKARE